MTPTICTLSPSSVIVRPTTDGSRPNSRAHIASLNTSEAGAVSHVSSSRSVRPRCAGAPSVAKRLPVTNTTRMRRLLPMPARVWLDAE